MGKKPPQILLPILHFLFVASGDAEPVCGAEADQTLVRTRWERTSEAERRAGLQPGQLHRGHGRQIVGSDLADEAARAPLNPSGHNCKAELLRLSPPN